MLTDYHVIDGAARTGGVTVEFEDNIDPPRRGGGRRLRARTWPCCTSTCSGVPPVQPLKLGDSTTVRVGDPTLTIGNPFGVDRTLDQRDRLRAAASRSRPATGATIDNVIQTDQPINAGNSGGPLLDASGYVIGINSQVAITGAGARPGQALAFAVPIDTADTILNRVARARAGAAGLHRARRRPPSRVGARRRPRGQRRARPARPRSPGSGRAT